MGMYTELNLKIRLKPDVSEVVKLALIGEGKQEHMFFNLPRTSSVRAKHLDGLIYSVQANIKNYDSEIQLFIDWISPHLDHQVGEVIGSWCYEEWIDPVEIVYGEPLKFGVIEL